MRLQRPLVGLFMMIAYVLVFGDTGDPSCYSTSGNDITFDGGCSNSKTVDVYFKAQELKMDLTPPAEYMNVTLVALTVGGCPVEQSFQVAPTGPEKSGVFLINSIQVNTGKFGAKGYEFDGQKRYYVLWPIHLEELQGGWYKVGVSINPAITIPGMKIKLKDATFTAPPYSWWLDAWPWLLGTGLGGFFFVLSVIGGYIGYRRYKNRQAQPTLQNFESPAAPRPGAQSRNHAATPDAGQEVPLTIHLGGPVSPFAALEDTYGVVPPHVNPVGGQAEVKKENPKEEKPQVVQKVDEPKDQNVKAKKGPVEETCKSPNDDEKKTKDEAPNAEAEDHLPKDKKKSKKQSKTSKKQSKTSKPKSKPSKKKNEKKEEKKEEVQEEVKEVHPLTTAPLKTAVEEPLEDGARLLEPRQINPDPHVVAQEEELASELTTLTNPLARHATTTGETSAETSDGLTTRTAPDCTTWEVDNTQTGSEEYDFKVPTTEEMQEKVEKTKEHWNGDPPAKPEQKIVKKDDNALQQAADVLGLKRLIKMGPAKRRYELYFKYNIQAVGNMTIRLQDRIKELMKKTKKKPDELKTLTELLKMVKELATLCDEIYDYKIGKKNFELPWSFSRISELGMLKPEQYFDGVCADPLTLAEITWLESCYHSAEKEYKKNKQAGAYTPREIKEFGIRFMGIYHLIELSRLAQEAVIKIRPKFNTHCRVPSNYASDWSERFCKED